MVRMNEKKDFKEIETKIINWLKQKLKQANAKGFIIGLSGGIDSSVTAVLCKKTNFPVLGLIMPCLSNPKDREDAEKVAEKFGIKYKIIDLSNVFKEMIKILEGREYKGEKTLETINLKPRLRMATLYYFANKLNYLVVGTDNKSEKMTGYFTKYGDGGVDILPLADLFKKDIRKLAKHLSIPREIIDKKPSAGLWHGQTDEDELGISYEKLDWVLEKIEQNKEEEIDKETLEKVKNLIKKSEHKRKMPPMCKLT